MSNNVKSLLRVRRTTLASAAALAIGAAAPALATPIDNGYYRFGQFDGSADQTLALNNYALWITTPQLSTGYLAGTAVGINYQTLLSGPAATGTPATLSGNSIAALAAANQSASRIDLSLLARGTDGSDGMAIMTGQVRRDAASQALVSGSGVAIRLDGMPVADQTLSANSLSASVTLNKSATSVDGALPADYAFGRSGRVSSGMDLAAGNAYMPFGNSIGIPGTMLESHSDASVNITTAQVNSNAGQRAGSNATLVNSGVTLAATTAGNAEGGNLVASQLSITGNDLGAQYTGNRATSQFSAQGGAATFGGSVAVSNLQANVDDAIDSEFEGTGATARVAGVAIRADLLRGEGYPTALTGAVAITGNSVIARSTGNSATSSDANGMQSAGNAIVLSGATDVRGGDSYRSNVAGVFGGTAGNDVRADLALSSVQGNLGTGFVSDVSGTSVAARLDQVAAGGSVALNGNTVAAAATGNIAGNRVQVDATRISASTAVSNTQTNAWTDVRASNSAARIETSIGAAGLDVAGTVSLSSNRIDASASGNVADSQLVLAATHLAAGGAQAGAIAMNWDGGLAGTSGDATAVNVQANQGGSVTAQLAGGGVAASFANPQSGFNSQVGLQGASVSLKDNVLRSQATGNDAVTGVSLAATTAATSAALASMQTNSAWVSSEVSGVGVTLNVDRVLSSTVALDGNTLASGAIGNRADNRLTAQVGSLQAGGNGYGDGFFLGEGGAANSASAGFGSATASLTLLNAQSNRTGVDASNVSSGGMVRATFGSSDIYEGGEGYGWSTLASSDISVRSNSATASATANQAANTLSLQAGALAAGNGIGGPVAALNNVQSSSTEDRSSAVTGGRGGQMLVGVQFGSEVESSKLSVTGNTVSASNLGNTVANRLEAAGTSELRAAEGASTQDLRGDNYYGAVRNDYSLVNRQSDSGAGRSASTRHVTVGIEDTNSWWGGSDVWDSTLSVTGNRSLAEVRNNDAANAISLVGFSALGAGAGMLNGQNSSSAASASADGKFRLRARDMGIFGSTLALTDNATQALAVGNVADNRIVAQATALQGAGAIAGADPFSSEEGIAVASAAGFALGNVQSQSGAVEARTTGSARIDLEWSGVFSTTANLTGNLSAAVAQGNSGTNALALGATTASGVTGAVASVQSATGAVAASAGQRSGDGAFLVRGQALFDTQATVSNNTLRASAGQNEAFNQLAVSASSINAGNNLSAFTFESVPGADFSVSNQQYGAGNVGAAATPGAIGVVGDYVSGGNFTVSGNQVSAKATVNSAGNALTLAAGAVQGASGALSNLQSTGTGAVTASVGSYDSMTMVGVQPWAMNGTAVAVTGNSLAALAGGNSGSNVLNATGATMAAGGAASPSFAVLNSQSNAAAMDAAVRNATIGVAMNGYGYEGNGFNSASASVLANSVAASGYGNTASNAIALSMPQAVAGTATASLISRQTNTATISATVSNVSIGLLGATANGSNAVVSGNSVSAQAVGNSVANTTSVK